MKYQIIIVIMALIGAFYGGRYSVPVAVNQVKDVDKETHTETVTITQKDGTTKTVTKKDTSTKSEARSATAVVSKDKVYLQLMYGFKFSDRSPMYGVSLTKTIIGPLNGGIFYMTDSRFSDSVLGLTAGWEF